MAVKGTINFFGQATYEAAGSATINDAAQLLDSQQMKEAIASAVRNISGMTAVTVETFGLDLREVE